MVGTEFLLVTPETANTNLNAYMDLYLKHMPEPRRHILHRLEVEEELFIRKKKTRDFHHFFLDRKICLSYFMSTESYGRRMSLSKSFFIKCRAMKGEGNKEILLELYTPDNIEKIISE